MVHLKLLFFFIILNSILIGQSNPDYYVNKKANVVLAQSGLNIRSKPSLESEKVGKVPFGERIIVCSVSTTKE